MKDTELLLHSPFFSLPSPRQPDVAAADLFSLGLSTPRATLHDRANLLVAKNKTAHRSFMEHRQLTVLTVCVVPSPPASASQDYRGPQDEQCVGCLLMDGPQLCECEGEGFVVK